MTSMTTAHDSYAQENVEADECCENIPPGVTGTAGTSKLKAQVEDNCSTYEENKPLSDTSTFSTPAPTSSNGGGPAKSQISRFQSTLTPILKHENSTNLSVRLFNFGFLPEKSPVYLLKDEYLPEISFLDGTCDSTMQLSRNDSALPDSAPTTPVTARCVKSTFTTPHSLHLNSFTDLKTTPIPCPQNPTVGHLQSKIGITKVDSRATDEAGSPFKDTTATSFVMKQNSSADKAGVSSDVQGITFETQLPKKCSGTLWQAVATTFHPEDNNFDCEPKQNDTITLSEPSSSDSHQSTMDMPSTPKVYNAITSTQENNSERHPLGLSKHTGTMARTETNTKLLDPPESKNAPETWLDDRYFPQITLLDVTRNSELSPEGERSSMGITQDIPPLDSLKANRPLLELIGQTVADAGRLNLIQSEDLSNMSVQSDRSVGDNTIKTSLEVTRDITVSSVLENSESSSEPGGPEMVKIQTSAEEKLGTQPANITRDISSSSDMSTQSAQFFASDMECNTSSTNVTLETLDTVEANSKELLTSCDTKLTNKVPQPTPKTAGNSTFTLVQPSNLSASTDVNDTAPISCPQNPTFDLPPSNASSPKVGIVTDQTNSVATEASLVPNQNCSNVKESSQCEVQNRTYDRLSLQKSSSNTTLEVNLATASLFPHTFDYIPPPKQTGTITLSETGTSNSHKLASPEVCNLTTSLADSNARVHPPELSTSEGSAAPTDPEAKVVETPGSAFEANPVLEVCSGAGRRRTKDLSRLSLTDCLSDISNPESTDKDANKASTFSLDDTLVLKTDSLSTSTPMTNCKMFSNTTEREDDKMVGAQKKLYRDGPSKPVDQMPSNIVTDRKTILTKGASKSFCPPSKPVRQLFNNKPASALPGRLKPLTSGLPMTRQRTQVEVSRNAAASDASQRTTTGISSSYNLRAKSGSKQPTSGLQRPQVTGILLGVQRAAPGLRPPSTRGIGPASSNDKLGGPTAPNPVRQTSQAKKHPLTRGDALPVSKRKKMDNPMQSTSAEASTSSCDAANRAKNLKQPPPSQRAGPAKTQRDDAPVPASTAGTSTSGNAPSTARTLKQPAASHRNLLVEPQGNGCARCAVLEEEIRRLKEELLPK